MLSDTDFEEPQQNERPSSSHRRPASRLTTLKMSFILTAVPPPLRRLGFPARPPPRSSLTRIGNNNSFVDNVRPFSNSVKPATARNLPEQIRTIFTYEPVPPSNLWPAPPKPPVPPDLLSSYSYCQNSYQTEPLNTIIAVEPPPPPDPPDLQPLIIHPSSRVIATNPPVSLKEAPPVRPFPSPRETQLSSQPSTMIPVSPPQFGLPSTWTPAIQPHRILTSNLNLMNEPQPYFPLTLTRTTTPFSPPAINIWHKLPITPLPPRSLVTKLFMNRSITGLGFSSESTNGALTPKRTRPEDAATFPSASIILMTWIYLDQLLSRLFHMFMWICWTFRGSRRKQIPKNMVMTTNETRTKAMVKAWEWMKEQKEMEEVKQGTEEQNDNEIYYFKKSWNGEAKEDGIEYVTTNARGNTREEKSKRKMNTRKPLVADKQALLAALEQSKLHNRSKVKTASDSLYLIRAINSNIYPTETHENFHNVEREAGIFQFISFVYASKRNNEIEDNLAKKV